MGDSAGVSRRAEDAYSTDTPGLCSQFLLESELFVYFCLFIYIILVILYSLLCLSVFHVWYLSLDYIDLISARILVPLITLGINIKVIVV